MLFTEKEIAPDEDIPKVSATLPVFIIQKPLNGAPCYDFWLEIEDSLNLWQVLAGSFQAAGQPDWGAHLRAAPDPLFWEDLALGDGAQLGPQMVWDAGEYRHIGDGNRGLRQALERGEVRLWLAGERLKGEYVMLRLQDQANRSNWLLVKAEETNE